MTLLRTLLCALATTLMVSASAAAAQAPDSASLFAVTFTTGPSWDQTKSAGEQQYMREHSRNLFRLRDEGRIAMGSRFGEYGLIVVRAASLDAARALFGTDPAVANGVFTMQIDAWLTLFDGCIPAAGSNGGNTPTAGATEAPTAAELVS
jgi:uncharacterized protein YciI